ncbi:MAG: LptF/LptG family permease [Bacteroidota bacterium]|nr:LptF/LptG family permease [Bacteroidota bacterium]MDP4233644.1 LptF/LptG family permease [Bacteroidota bacterium]MDP4243096.1 LptF/LptG family permease [Bacteroidota bacterium]MDP4288458.1 LptF/LptG family permease [Bacteroidota bacterium]
MIRWRQTNRRAEKSRWRLFKLLDIYVLKQFFLATMVGIVGFIIIYIAVDLMEKLDKFLDHNVPFMVVVEYYVNFTPQIIALILSVALLLGSLFTTGRMSANNEIIAMRSAGISLYRLMAPFIVASMLLCLGAIYFNGWILPKANARVEEILRDYVHEDIINNAEFNMYLQDSPTSIVSMSDYSFLQKRANRVSVQFFDPKEITHMTRRIDASLMSWDSTHNVWTLTNATERLFLSDTSAEQIRKLAPAESVMHFTFTPAELRERLLKVEEMTNPELARRIELKRRSGQDVARDLVDYQSKYSLAFTSLIVVLFGVPFASRKKRGGLSFEFSIAIGIAFAFLTFSKVSQTFGYTGQVPAVLTAWLANILFLAGAIVVIWKAQK